MQVACENQLKNQTTSASADETESEWEKAVSQLVEKGGEMEQLRSMMPAVKDSAALISQADFIKSSFRLEDCPPTKG